jgi:hypothetical protein
VHVLRRMIDATRPGGIALDLQVIRPNPRVEAEGRFVCEMDGMPLFEMADAAVAAVEALVATGRLVEEAVDDHDVLKHYAGGEDLIADWARGDRRPLGDGRDRILRLAGPCVTRERCRLRRLRARAI